MPDSPSAPVDYRVLFEQSAGFYCVLDPQFRIVAATQAYCGLARMRQDDMLGHVIYELFPDNAERPDVDGPRNLRASLLRVLQYRRPDAMATQRYDVERPASEGGGFEEKYWSPLNVPVLNDDGSVRWIIHRVHDVTDAMKEPSSAKSMAQLARDQELIIRRLRDANEELASLDKLRAAMVQMSRLNTMAMMAAALAHDISQPLSAARNYLGALKLAQSVASDSSATELIAKSTEQISRASEIVRGLRSYVMSGATEHRSESLAPILREAMRLAESVARTAGAKVIDDIAADLPAVFIDRVQIQQVMVNLIANAAEATRGCARREIRISARPEDKVVQVEVADTGSGISEDVRKRLFEPFTTTKMTGMGLGLPICMQIIKEHEGRLWSAPNTPTGTVFAFTLPTMTAALQSADDDAPRQSRT